MKNNPALTEVWFLAWWMLERAMSSLRLAMQLICLRIYRKWAEVCELGVARRNLVLSPLACNSSVDLTRNNSSWGSFAAAENSEPAGATLFGSWGHQVCWPSAKTMDDTNEWERREAREARSSTRESDYWEIHHPRSLLLYLKLQRGSDGLRGR